MVFAPAMAPVLGVARDWKLNMICVEREGRKMFDWFEEVEDFMLYGPLAEEEAELNRKRKKREEEEDDSEYDDIV
jgi:hypothetical protein